MNPLSKRTLAALVLLFATAVGCAPGDRSPGQQQRPPSLREFPTLLSVDSLVLPIEPYLFTDRQVARLLQARAVLTASCMRRFGHPWPVPKSAPPDTGTRNPANTAHRYGLTDAVAASRHGYHPAPGSPQKQVKSKVAAGPTPAPAHMLVATGLNEDGTPAQQDDSGRALPRGGCLGEATAALSGSPDKIGNRELVGAINIGSYQQSQRDPRVTAVFGAWSRCMQRYGYDYADPTRAPGRSPLYQTDTAGPAEIALARRDVSCKRDTNVVGVWSAVDADYQRRVMREKKPELAAIAADIRTQLANADRVLGGH
ncbi:hypothetical protein [Streptomyces albipurpureus]|uniref:Lipoprotein n=1 Tax=Streptomyces albipurpureus TaxID=2897419 RepID=A0ABT0UR50_9ACTN|nr:hypothetical protein [Streptomyces sp. CWNU-1]MCM2390575.1 hypothetical protein [Streptomyces sp. CWNU-1]